MLARTCVVLGVVGSKQGMVLAGKGSSRHGRWSKIQILEGGCLWVAPMPWAAHGCDCTLAVLHAWLRLFPALCSLVVLNLLSLCR
jgi:hypothetical protein